MKYIDESRIEELLTRARTAGSSAVQAILAKAKSLQRLSLEETAVLLACNDDQSQQDILAAASSVKDAVYGRRVVLFTPLYISNICRNTCVYCSFKADNTGLKRKALTIEEIKREVVCLLQRGHKRILMVAGESAPAGISLIDYYVSAIKAVYEVSVGAHRIKRVNINCAPLSAGEFEKLKDSGIGTYQIFQETYHDATYRAVHPSWPKSDPDNRIEAVERAFQAGIDDIGMGVLYGLYDWKFDTLALLMHIEELEKKFKIGPHTLSVPRIEPAAGAEFSRNPAYAVSDADFKKLVAVLRLSVPYTGIILSTRESPQLRNELCGFGVSQMSAESRTSPGGYAENSQEPNGQFDVADHRSLDEVMASLIEKDYVPSFCAACYRAERTGEAFMCLAKPGTIKGKCNMNALITLKEYLDDFASPEVKHQGYKLIHRMRDGLDDASRHNLEHFFTHINQGIRDEFV